MVLPPSWLAKFLTFSKRMAFGRFAMAILTTSKNSVPFASSRKPIRLPVMEKD